jgi:hypothetical protein
VGPLLKEDLSRLLAVHLEAAILARFETSGGVRFAPWVWLVVAWRPDDRTRYFFV